MITYRAITVIYGDNISLYGHYTLIAKLSGSTLQPLRKTPSLDDMEFAHTFWPSYMQSSPMDPKSILLLCFVPPSSVSPTSPHVSMATASSPMEPNKAC